MFRCISQHFQVELKCSLLKNSFYATIISGTVVLYMVQWYLSTIDNNYVKEGTEHISLP